MNTDFLEKIVSAQQHIKQKKYLEALYILDTLIKSEGLSSSERNIATLEKGIVLYKQKKWKNAEHFLASIQADNPTHHKYIFYYAESLRTLGEKYESEVYYALALHHNPLNENYLNAYVNATSYKKREAVDKLNEIANNNKEKNFKILAHIAKEQLASNKEISYSTLLKSASFLSKKPDVIYTTATLLAAAGKYHDAFECIEFAIALHSQKSTPPAHWTYQKAELSKKSIGIENFGPLEDSYNIQVRPCGGNQITIVLGSLANKYLLGNYNFGTSTIFISEKETTYYTYNFNSLKNYIAEYVLHNGYKYVNLIGPSKGGFGAITLASQLSIIASDLHFRVLAFSPQTHIGITNSNLAGLPSLKRLHKNTLTYPALKTGFDNNCDTRTTLQTAGTNLAVYIIYGEKNSKDCIEAEYLRGIRNVILMPIPDFPLHATIALYSKKGKDLDAALKNGITGGGDGAYFMDKTMKYDTAPFITEERFKYLDITSLLLSIP